MACEYVVSVDNPKKKSCPELVSYTRCCIRKQVVVGGGIRDVFYVYFFAAYRGRC